MRNTKIGAALLMSALTAVVALSGCGADTTPAKGEKLKIYATTGYLADAVGNIAPDATVTTMVGPGGDPHTYQPSTKDIEAMRAADVVVWNGLHLEAQMIDQLESLGDKQLAVGAAIPSDMLLDWPEVDQHGEPLHDPHIWNSPEIWSNVVGQLAEKLAATDAAKADTYRANAEKYQAQIKKMATDSIKKLSAIPSGSRTLITGHDAFNYFGKTFKIEVHATDFVSSEAKLSAAELSELADLIASKKIPVIFQDNLSNPQAIKALKEAVQSRNWQVEISDTELFADSLGAEPGVDTYLGVFEHNVEAIAKALTPTKA